MRTTDFRLCFVVNLVSKFVNEKKERPMMNNGVHSAEEDDGDIGDISSNSSIPSLHISNGDLDQQNQL